MQRRFLLAASVGLAAIGAAFLNFGAAARAEEYPAKPIRMLVGFAPGGPADGLARIVGQAMGDAMKQPFVIENRPGAGGTIAVGAAAKSDADGYTLLLVSSGHAGNTTYYQTLPYDPAKDFAPVGGVASSPVAIIVQANAPYKNLADLLAAAKANPGKLNYGTGGGATLTNLAAEVLKQDAGIQATGVAYRGSGPALTALLGGEIDFMFDTVSSAIGQIRGGRMRALAVTSKVRSSVLPDVPTAHESALPGFEVDGWFGILAPAATPKPILARLNAELNKALKTPDVTQRFATLGADPLGGEAAKFGALIDSETLRWGKVIKALGLKAD